MLHSNTLFTGENEYGPISRCANSGGLSVLRESARADLDSVAARVVRQSQTTSLPPVRLGKRGKPTQKDWQRFWSAQCEEITAAANDQVRRRKERKKALGALKAEMRKGDLVEAGQYRHLIEVYFGADDDTVADSSERHDGGLQEDAAAGRSDQDSIVAVDSGEAETPTTTRPTRQSAPSPTSGDELENIIGTQVDEDLNADSQGTTVDDDFSQQQPSPGSSSGSGSAADTTRFRSH